MPTGPAPDVVERRLALQRDLLGQLRGVEPLTALRLSAEPLLRAAIERILQAVVDLALDINGHIASNVLKRSPSTGRESFDLMVTAGALEADFAARLKPAVGLRNVLVHLYADIDVELVAGSAAEFERLFSEYVQRVARWLIDISAGEEDRSTL